MSNDIPNDMIVGSLAGEALYVVTISGATLRRARELTGAGAAPNWVEHGTTNHIFGDVRVATTNPQWFLELDRSIRARLP